MSWASCASTRPSAEHDLPQHLDQRDALLVAVVVLHRAGETENLHRAIGLVLRRGEQGFGLVRAEREPARENVENPPALDLVEAGIHAGGMDQQGGRGDLKGVLVGASARGGLPRVAVAEEIPDPVDHGAAVSGGMVS